MFKRRKPLLAIVAITLALVFVGAGSAVAAATYQSGTSVARTAVFTEDAAATYGYTSFTTIRTFPIYAQAGSPVLMRFTAESACYGGYGYCSARILIDGVEASPVAGLDFAFDSTNYNRETAYSWASHSMERTRAVTYTGNHTISLQLAKSGTGVVHRIDDWTFTVFTIAI